MKDGLALSSAWDPLAAAASLPGSAASCRRLPGSAPLLPSVFGSSVVSIGTRQQVLSTSTAWNRFVTPLPLQRRPTTAGTHLLRWLHPQVRLAEARRLSPHAGPFLSLTATGRELACERTLSVSRPAPAPAPRATHKDARPRHSTIPLSPGARSGEGRAYSMRRGAAAHPCGTPGTAARWGKRGVTSVA